MKKAILFCIVTLLFACHQASENNAKRDASMETELESKTEDMPFDEEELIADIRKKFGEINQNSASYETRSTELTAESTEGGELKSFYQNGELKKAVASYFGEMGKLTEEYYFSEGQVFFIFTQQYTYDKPITVEGSKVTKTDENRYYFHDHKLIRWLDPKKEKVDKSNFNQQESEILQKVEALKDKLGISKTGSLPASKDDHDYIDMKTLFSLSPLSVFDDTTEGLTSAEKNELLKKGESDTWKIIDESTTKLTIQCKQPSSEVTFHFLKNKDNPDGLLFAQIVNGENTHLLSWSYSHEEKNLQQVNPFKKYTANDFVSKEDRLPDSYHAVMYYLFIDDQTIEVSPHTWMEKEFENRKIIHKIYLKWNGEDFVEKIEKI